MRVQHMIWASLLLTGCNLFTSSASPSDMAPDVPDQSILRDVGTDMLAQPDVTRPDSERDMSSSRVWASISTGTEHSCALTTSGVAYCWGFGDDGRLGSGGTDRELVPVAVASAPSFAQLVAGGDHTCALDAAGALWCWGAGSHFGAPSDQTTPFLVASGPFSKLSVGDDNVCVIDADDLIKCIGENDVGQLGLPTSDDVAILTDLGGAPFPALDVAAGNEFTCGLGSDGAVTCFGRDLSEPDNEEDADTFLTQPITTPTPLVSLTAGWAHACGQSADGSLFCWGEPPLVQSLTTGGGPTTAGEVPLVVDFVHIDSGNDVVCGLDDEGTSYCLGSNYRAVQGKGSDNPDSGEAEPLERMATSTPFHDLSVGSRHGCAITMDDELMCWGQGFDGRLGNGEVGWRAEPQPVDSAIEFTTAVLGDYHACGLDTDGAMHCWGRGAYGALGNGSYDHAYAPTEVVGLTFVTADAWASHVCGLLANGTGYCWGTERKGVLGNGAAGSGNAPDLIQAPEAFTTISVNAEHACAIGVSQNFCWGDNLDIGEDLGGNRPTPNALPLADHPAFVQLSAGTQHSCGVDSLGDGFCFGVNDAGQLGDGTNSTSRYASVAVVGGLTFRLIRAGNNFSCGITMTDELHCWGVGVRVPDGSDVDRNTPTAEAAGLTWSDVNLSETHACGVTIGGDVYCWGSGGSGRLGYGGLSNRNTPSPVNLPEAAVHVAAGGSHSCAVGVSGQMYCWGSQEFGRLGDGADAIVREPMPVVVDHLDVGQ